MARFVSRLLELRRIEAADEPFQLVDIEELGLGWPLLLRSRPVITVS
jgi:hypothetical protein